MKTNDNLWISFRTRFSWNGIERIQNLVTAQARLVDELSAWLRIAQRRVARLSLGVKWGCWVALIAAVRAVELLAGEAVSLSLLYGLLVGVAVWLIDTQAGFAVAAICCLAAAVPERGAQADGRDWALVGVRFAALSGVVLSASVLRRAQLRLIREVANRTGRLRAESSHRRRLEAEILQLARREHGYLAQQIHDELGQYISALSYHAKMLSEDLHEVPSVHAGRADRVVDLIRSTNEAIRRLGRGAQVPDGGFGEFVDALRHLADDFAQLTGVKCTFRCTAGPLAIDSFRAMMLFRIVQEACSNAVKHGNPKSIAIFLSVRGASLRVEIDDDGCGFSANSAVHSGIGLQIMRRRAALIGATLRIHSAVVGCTLACDVPLPGRCEAVA